MKKLKTILSFAVSAALCAAAPAPGSASAEAEVFFDDFSGDGLDTGKWLVAEKNWGGTVTNNGATEDYNGGVIRENVRVEDGSLVLTGLGNRYEGELRGINRDGSRRPDGARCGGAIATREYFASGSYEIRAKIAPELGCCSAMWTFEYEENYSDGRLDIVNHEIDIEFPGRDDNGDLSLSRALCTAWTSEEDYKTESVSCGPQADGEFHTYRFDWRTGGNGVEPRVDYYFDGELAYTCREHIPSNASRFWLGLWFPKGWAGKPDFASAEFVVDYAKITPFHDPGDTPQNETYPDGGWAEVSEPPKGWLLWHVYSSYAARDSKLYLRDPEGEVSEIKGSFVSAMNGSFGDSPDRITFMAIDPEADEWDIFLLENGKIQNLTEKSGFRNEDPRFSPDGRSVVFKRGRWDSGRDDFAYDLALLDLETREITMLTDDPVEEAMACFSEDGEYVYYAAYEGGYGSIRRLELASGVSENVFSEPGVTAYYPAAHGDELYFTKYCSAENRCDWIMLRKGGSVSALPFDSPDYDCSDPCPIGGGKIIFSGAMNGDYDLYLWDGERVSPLSGLDSRGNELGAAFFSYEDYLKTTALRGDVNSDGEFGIADIVLLQRRLLGCDDPELKAPKAADLDGDGLIDGFDLCLMRIELLECEKK